MKRLLKLGLFFLVLLILDLSLKSYVFHNVSKMSWMHPFYPYGGIGVFENFLGVSFSINHVENTGAAWGILSNYTKSLFILRIVIVVALGIYIGFFNKNRKTDFPFLLIITGAIGNILDFFFYGKVIDMFHFIFFGYSYPVFNLADAMITIGIGWLIVVFIMQNFKKLKS